VEVGIGELQISARAKAIVYRVENCGLTSITGTDKAIYSGRREPGELLDAAKILNGQFANARHSSGASRVVGCIILL
jgi:hypothetical protein